MTYVVVIREEAFREHECDRKVVVLFKRWKMMESHAFVRPTAFKSAKTSAGGGACFVPGCSHGEFFGSWRPGVCEV